MPTSKKLPYTSWPRAKARELKRQLPCWVEVQFIDTRETAICLAYEKAEGGYETDEHGFVSFDQLVSAWPIKKPTMGRRESNKAFLSTVDLAVKNAMRGRKAKGYAGVR